MMLEAFRLATEDGPRPVLLDRLLPRRKPRVLIVDDQPDLLGGFRQLMESDGIEIFMLPSLITLPLRLKEIDPDVILVDVNMPALSGTALFSKELRRSLKTTALLILFSGIASKELGMLAERLGADGALSKRLDVADSLRRVRSWIQRRQATSDASLPIPRRPLEGSGEMNEQRDV